MKQLNARLASQWANISPRFLPFADAATPELPMVRLLRLSMFQFSVAMAVVLLNGTLNRVMIVELGVPSFIVALMVSLPLLFAPLRALIGYRSDSFRSALGWRRVPFIWFGSMLQFGGLAIMPFALLILSGDTTGPAWVGTVGAALAFLLVGAGLHTTQTAGLALATDLAPAGSRPRVVAFLYVMLLVGMVVSAFVFSALLANFSQLRLIQVVQGAAVVTMAFNIIALWKQEARNPALATQAPPEHSFSEAWRSFTQGHQAVRALVAVGLGTAAFSMQDILLEPYGGEILNLTVGETTALTGLLALGTLAGFALAGHSMTRGADPYRLAAFGAIVGLAAFPAVMLAAPAGSAILFRVGVVLIGFGAGLFAVSTLTAAMAMAQDDNRGLALGAWGAVQATAAGLAIALGGAVRDIVSTLANSGALGDALSGPAVGYNAVYNIEILLLFATLVAIGPLVRPVQADRPLHSSKFGLSEFPG
ncbi:MAG: MFS transporter [Hyphomicrobium sp.]|nr:MAG: MFS transporter [Hyphomicrobium sp.]PPD00406.1 MAG: MFS transporter [Hyphomicrobium sp.]